MTKTSKAPKAPKAVAPKAVKIKIEKATSTAGIVESYKALTNESRHLELAFILEVAEELNAGRVTVRSVKASITEAIKASGNAPTIRPAHAQFFVTLSKMVATINNADNMSVSALLKLAQRLASATGADGVESALDGIESIEELDKATPHLTAQRKIKAKASASKESTTAKSIVAQALAQLSKLNGAQLVTDDAEALTALNTLIKEIAKNSAGKIQAKRKVEVKVNA